MPVLDGDDDEGSPWFTPARSEYSRRFTRKLQKCGASHPIGGCTASGWSCRHSVAGGFEGSASKPTPPSDYIPLGRRCAFCRRRECIRRHLRRAPNVRAQGAVMSYFCARTFDRLRRTPLHELAAQPSGAAPSAGWCRNAPNTSAASTRFCANLLPATILPSVTSVVHARQSTSRAAFCVIGWHDFAPMLAWPNLSNPPAIQPARHRKPPAASPIWVKGARIVGAPGRSRMKTRDVLASAARTFRSH
jgi:hypothetical protein